MEEFADVALAGSERADASDRNDGRPMLKISLILDDLVEFADVALACSSASDASDRHDGRCMLSILPILDIREFADAALAGSSRSDASDRNDGEPILKILRVLEFADAALACSSASDASDRHDGRWMLSILPILDVREFADAALAGSSRSDASDPNDGRPVLIVPPVPDTIPEFVVDARVESEAWLTDCVGELSTLREAGPFGPGLGENNEVVRRNWRALLPMLVPRRLLSDREGDVESLGEPAVWRELDPISTRGRIRDFCVGIDDLRNTSLY